MDSLMMRIKRYTFHSKIIVEKILAANMKNITLRIT